MKDSEKMNIKHLYASPALGHDPFEPEFTTEGLGPNGIRLRPTMACRSK